MSEERYEHLLSIIPLIWSVCKYSVEGDEDSMRAADAYFFDSGQA